MVEEGIAPEAARDAIAVLDSHGLVVEDRPDLEDDKRAAALPRSLVASLGLDPDAPIGLHEVVAAFHPTVLLGTTGRAGTFEEATIREMAAHVAVPIVMPLSNPTANTEARPADIVAWTDGRAIVATGSPFPPVEVGGASRRVPQANNAYVFPGIGLGAIVAEARTLPESTFLVAARRLADLAPADARATGALFPPIGGMRLVAREIAIAVVAHLGELGVGRRYAADAIAPAVDAAMWNPDYVPYEAV
jgi:malic enzyme